MRVLTRKADESIMIGDDIEVKLLDIKENQVKIGISAPKNVAVHRRRFISRFGRRTRKRRHRRTPMTCPALCPSRRRCVCCSTASRTRC